MIQRRANYSLGVAEPLPLFDGSVPPPAFKVSLRVFGIAKGGAGTYVATLDLVYHIPAFAEGRT